MGNLTRDVELRHAGESPVTDVGIAVNEKQKKNGEWIEEVTFVDVTLWGRLAEIAAEYCQKGSPVLIEGRLKLDSWEKDGKKNYKLKVVGEQFRMLGGKGDQTNQERPERSSEYNQAPPKKREPAQRPPDDEIPF
jgi:single-strand DNA-binding protein